jgi:hypothetical protein
MMYVDHLSPQPYAKFVYGFANHGSLSVSSHTPFAYNRSVLKEFTVLEMIPTAFSLGAVI